MKKLFKRIAGATLLLTLVSCCFLGSTFAKYSSSKDGSATTNVALWQVDGISANSTTDVSFDLTAGEKLSPNHNDGTNTVATGTYKVENKSDVKAKISVSTPAITYYSDEGTTVYAQDKAYKTGSNLTNTELGSVFSVVYKWSATETGTYNADFSTAELAASNGVLFVKAEITWTTPSTDGDAIDTAIGMYVKQVKATVTLTAEQSSSTPTV